MLPRLRIGGDGFVLVFGQIVLIVGVALALCCYVGWGAARLALPASLRPLANLCTPLVGYAILVWGGYLGVRTVLSVPWSLAVLLVAATVLNVFAWRRRTVDERRTTAGHFRLSSFVHRPSSADWLLCALLLTTLLVGVWPLLRYGYLTAIGRGWDTESALPLAQYLLDGPLSQIPQNPISPLRDLVAHPPAIGKTLGFAVWQGMTMLVSRQSALETFAPLLALLRTLGVLAVYLWLVATMGLRKRWALLGAALTSAGGLLLWVTYFNFEKQLAGWPLIPFGLMIGLAAIEELAGRRWAAWPALLLGAIVLAAQPIAYYPALTIWVPLAGALGAVRVFEAWRSSGRSGARALVAATAVLAALTAVFAAPSALDYFQGFSFRYSLPAQHVGPDRFIAPTEILGLQTFRIALDGAQPPAPLVWLALGLVIVFGLCAFLLPTTDHRPPTTDHRPPTTDHRLHTFSAQSSVLSPQSPAHVRLRWLATLGTVVVYLLWLRFSRDYEYAYMKGSAYIAFVGWGVFALGAQSLAARFARRQKAKGERQSFTKTNMSGYLLPFAFYLGVAIPLLVVGRAQSYVIAEHDDGPAAFTRDIAAFEDAAAQVPRGASLLISSDEAFIGPIGGLFSTMLHGREIWGHLVTAYSGEDYWPEGRTPQYALLAANERPWPLEHGGRELWRSGAAALYQLGSREQALSGRETLYSNAPPLNRGMPGALATWRRGGANREIRPDAPLRLFIGDTLGFTNTETQGRDDLQQRQLTLTLATLAPQRVSIAHNTANTAFDLKAGVNNITVPTLIPSTITITPEQPLAFIEATTALLAQHQTSATLDEQQIAWRASAELRGTTIGVGVDLINPGQHALRFGFTLVEDTFQAPHQLARLLAAAPIEGHWQLNIDPTRGATESLVNKAATPLLSVSTQPQPTDGFYFGVLTVYDGEEPVAHAPVFTMQVAGGQLMNFAPVPFTVEATPVGRGRVLSSLRKSVFERGVVLDNQQATLEDAVIAYPAPAPGSVPANPPVAAGAALAVQLHWRSTAPAPQPLMVSVQVLGADDHKWAQWDGPVGGEWRPIASWQTGERVRQDVPLTLAGEMPPGTYRLLLVVYDPATGQPQPLGGQQATQLGTINVTR